MNSSGMVTVIRFLGTPGRSRATAWNPEFASWARNQNCDVWMEFSDYLKKDRPMAPCGRKSGNYPAIRGPSRPEYFFRTHHSSIISINQCNGLILSPCACSDYCPIQGHAHYPMATSNNTYENLRWLLTIESLWNDHKEIHRSILKNFFHGSYTEFHFYKLSPLIWHLNDWG